MNNAHHFSSSSSSSVESKQDRNDFGDLLGSPYHNWKLFAADFQEMLHKLKIFVYPDAYMNHSSSPFARIFLPNPNPFHPKLANYFSEHMFKVSLLRSSLLTTSPDDAHFFFLPFSVNSLRSDPRVHSEASISDFVTQYTNRVSREYKFWNASGGTDHFYVCCHSVGREAASKHYDLHNNAIQVTCSSSYFQRLYITHKDVGMPQVWPRPPEKLLNPLESRYRHHTTNSLSLNCLFPVLGKHWICAWVVALVGNKADELILANVTEICRLTSSLCGYNNMIFSPSQHVGSDRSFYGQKKLVC